MQANGRVQITAPKCIAMTGAEGALGQLRSGDADGQADGSNTKTFTTVDTTLTVSTVAGAAPATITVAERAGITIGQKLYLGVGTDHEESVMTHASAVTEGTGSGIIELAASQTLAYDHPANERVQLKTLNYGAIRPGSVVVKVSGGSGNAGIDDGKGAIITGGGTPACSGGTVDYSTGHVTAQFALGSTVSNNAVVTYNADKLADLPDQADLSGSGFQKNFFTTKGSRQPIPDLAAIQNLGDTNVGYFIEVSYNNGRTFTTKGFATAGNRAGTIGNFGRKIVEFPAGQGNIVDAVRIRAGQNSTSNDTIANEEWEKRLIWPGVLEVSHAALINSNGGSN
jgi:hypothetical protein